MAFNSNATAWKAFTSSSSNFPPSPPPATVGSIQLHGSSHDHPSGTSTSASNPSPAPAPAGAAPEPNPKPVDGADPKPACPNADDDPNAPPDVVGLAAAKPNADPEAFVDEVDPAVAVVDPKGDAAAGCPKPPKPPVVVAGAGWPKGLEAGAAVDPKADVCAGFDAWPNAD